MDARCWVYGCTEPTNLPYVENQILLAHRYRNQLVEIERRRREHALATVKAHSPGLDALQADAERAADELEALRQEVATANSEAGRRRAGPGERERVRGATAALKAARAAFRDAKKAAYADPGVKEALKAVDAGALDALKAARAAAAAGGIYWCNYLSAEESMAKARSGPPPRFRRWREGDGRVMLQIQKGLSLDDAHLGRDTRLRLTAGGPQPRSVVNRHGVELPRADPNSKRSARRKLCVAQIRVGSTEKGRPVWAEVRFVMHRPFPEGCRVKRVNLVRRRVGTHSDWTVQFSLDGESFRPDDLATSGRVAVDVGWRILGEGEGRRLRLAVWKGDDGDSGELVLPADHLRMWLKARELQSLRDRLFNGARDRLAGWLAANVLPLAPHLSQWRSPQRLAELVRCWVGGGVPADDPVFTELEEWRKKERHLYDWQTNLATKAVRRRNHAFRNLAAELRRRYREVIVEDTDWRRLAKRPEPEEDGDEAARVWRQVGAPGLLSATLKATAALGSEGPAAFTTQTCPACGELDPFDAARELVRTCAHCGTTRDQDERAADNLLAGPTAGAGESS
jgi:hypothetical protein